MSKNTSKSRIAKARKAETRKAKAGKVKARARQGQQNWKIYDRFLRRILSNPALAWQFLKWALPEALASRMTSRWPELVTDTFVTDDLRERGADLLLRVWFTGGTELLILIEHKCSPEQSARWQVKGYMDEAQNAWERSHGKLPSVYTIVLNHGASCTLRRVVLHPPPRRSGRDDRRRRKEIMDNWMLEHEEKGRQEGKQEGRQEGTATLLELLEERFGKLRSGLRARILSADMATLMARQRKFLKPADLESIFPTGHLSAGKTVPAQGRAAQKWTRRTGNMTAAE